MRDTSGIGFASFKPVLPAVTVELPEKLGQRVDKICAKDKRHFEKHPGNSQFDRRSKPEDGGLLIDLPRSAMVRVIKLSSDNNIRARWLFMPEDAPEHDLEAFRSELMRVGVTEDEMVCVIDHDTAVV
jgi:hypothetical protein